MVEVGWAGSPELDPEPGTTPTPASAAHSAPTPTPSGGEVEPDDRVENDPSAAGETVETIDDHYAALQAWNEWARNRGRTAAVVGGTERLAPDPDDSELPTEAMPAGLWVDAEQGFAPYGQLFSRLRQSRDLGGSS
jgi:general secretion pathway protein A